jgi:hypothetical protein
VTDTIAARIALAHGNLTAKLDELRQRGTRARNVLSPLGNPWLRAGVAVLAGYRLGLPHPTAPTTTVPARDETLTRAIVRASVLAIAQIAVRRAVSAFAGDDPSRHA